MRRKIMPGVMAAFLFVPLSAFTQTTEQPEWCNEYVSGVNKEQACQIAIPFADEQQAMNLAIEFTLNTMTANTAMISSAVRFFFISLFFMRWDVPIFITSMDSMQGNLNLYALSAQKNIFCLKNLRGIFYKMKA